MTNCRQDYYDPGEIMEELQRSLDLHVGDTDYVTFVGEGEPTLCKSLGSLVAHTKETAGLPVAVITNGSLLDREDVREELSEADVVMPSLDAADPETFRKLNRPHGAIQVAQIVEGMARFRQEFGGQLWVEVMLVRGLNDNEETLGHVCEALDRIGPNRVYVNVPIRPPAESWVVAPDTEGLVLAHALLGDVVFIDQPESGTFSTAGFDDPVEAVAMIVRRHPMRLEQIVRTPDEYSEHSIDAALHRLEADGRMQCVIYRGETYYAAAEGHYAAAL